jgi:hypothetical protein
MYWPEMTPITVTTRAGWEAIVPTSPLFLFCMGLSSHLFSLSAVALTAGLLLIERAKIIHRLEALEEEHQKLREPSGNPS